MLQTQYFNYPSGDNWNLSQHMNTRQYTSAFSPFQILCLFVPFFFFLLDFLIAICCSLMKTLLSFSCSDEEMLESLDQPCRLSLCSSRTDRNRSTLHIRPTLYAWKQENKQGNKISEAAEPNKVKLY